MAAHAHQDRASAVLSVRLPVLVPQGRRWLAADKTRLEAASGGVMESNRRPLLTWAIPDRGQPLSEAQRDVLDAAFEIMEQLLRGDIVLIVARMEDEGYSEYLAPFKKKE